MNDRLIYVVGTPSGGTSAVTGTLHHLGVDMGEYPESPGPRGYVNFEDINTNSFKVMPDGSDEPVVRQRLRLRDYISYRQKHQTDQRIGVKGSSLWWLAEPHVTAIPIDIVRVHRPLEKAIKSDCAKQRIIGDTIKNWPKVTPSRMLARAKAVSATWMGAELLCGLIPPVAEVWFEKLLATPEAEVSKLIGALRLVPTDKQIERALSFIDPNKRNF